MSTDVGCGLGTARVVSLMRLAVAAAHAGQPEVELTPSLIEELSTWDAKPNRIPYTLDLLVQIRAKDLGSIAAGEYDIVMGDHVGMSPAGRYVARFADMLGQPGLDMLTGITTSGHASQPSTGDMAEVQYSLGASRGLNIYIRPNSHRFELVVDGTFGSRSGPAIDDLVAVMSAGRLRQIVWVDEERSMQFVGTHLLNVATAPPIARFLLDWSTRGLAVARSPSTGDLPSCLPGCRACATGISY